MFGDSVLITLLLVDEADLRLTVPVVFNVEDWDEPDVDSRSDLIKPVAPLTLTLDQPSD